MSASTAMVLAIFALALVLLASNRVRIDVIGLGVLVALGLLRQLPPAALFSGFSSTAVLLIAGMLAMGEGLVASGATARLAVWLARSAGAGERRLAVALMTVAAIPSAFVSDVGLVGMLIPVVRDLHRRTRVPVRRLLMPLGVAATLGGLLTMVGSAGNIVGNAALTQAGYPPLGIFAITPLGAVLLLAGVAFMVGLGPRLIPAGSAPLDAQAGEEPLRPYVSELRVGPDSALVGRSLGAIPHFSELGLTVAEVGRGPQRLPANRETVLAAGDTLLVVGDPAKIVEAADRRLGLILAGDEPEGPRAREAGALALAEVLLGHRAPWIGHTAVELDLRRRWGIGLLGLYRQGQLLHHHLAGVRLRAGDLLLVQGAGEQLGALHRQHGVIVLNQPSLAAPARPYGLWAAPAILLLVLGLAAFAHLDLRLAIALGVFLMAAARLLSLSDAYRVIEWRIVVFVAGMMPLGTALIHTGVTAAIVSELARLATGWLASPYAVAGMLFVLAAALTQVLSNIATVLVLAPVAAELGRRLGWHPDPLVLAVIVAVSAAPLTPMANKVDLLIMGPGGYRYGDFLRMGAPLTLLLGLVTVMGLPLWFPFR